jgi:aspartate-semialdehyde dehydrogenase
MASNSAGASSQLRPAGEILPAANPGPRRRGRYLARAGRAAMFPSTEALHQGKAGTDVRQLRVAVVGATGAVGRELLTLLSRLDLPDPFILPVATARSAGSALGAELGLSMPIEPVRALQDVDFGELDVAFLCAGAEVSIQTAQKSGGCLVIDNSSAFRTRDDVPLVVPRVNREQLRTRPASNIIANPNCSTIQLVRALHPLHQLAGLRRVIMATYQAASGGGQRGLAELAATSQHVLGGGEPPPPGKFGPPLAFNLIPQIGALDETGMSHEEFKLRAETTKILGLAGVPVSATAVRVPIFHCHAEAVWAQFGRPISAAEAEDALMSTCGVLLYRSGDNPPFPTPRLVEKSGHGRAWVHVGRVRADPDDPCALLLWVTAENLWVGAALNAVDILQTVLDYGWLG